MDNRSCRTCFVSEQSPDIHLTPEARCQHCSSPAFSKRVDRVTRSDLATLRQIADEIRQHRTGTYDCVIGVSGGLDSSYAAYVVRRLLDLNPLLVHYDHTFGYPDVKANLNTLVKALDCDISYQSSRGHWDRKYVAAFNSALSHADLYWGICSFCHTILPTVIVKIAIQRGIGTVFSSTNLYESELCVSRKTKVDAMIRAVVVENWFRLPYTLFRLTQAGTFLLRLKQEFRVPPLSNLWRSYPRHSLRTINVTRYVPWDIDSMLDTLRSEIGWKLPQRPNLGMRFDCTIEDSFINHTYRRITGSTVQALIASNMIRAGIREKAQLEGIIGYYDRIIPERLCEIKNQLNSK